MACAEVCTTLERGLKEKKLNDLNDSVCEAIKQLTLLVALITRALRNSFLMPST